MYLGTITQAVRVSGTNGLTQALEPGPGPGELDTQYREPNRYDNQRRARRDQHHHTNDKYSYADDSDDNASRRFVRQVQCSLDQPSGPSFLPRLVVALGA